MDSSADIHNMFDGIAYSCSTRALAREFSMGTMMTKLIKTSKGPRTQIIGFQGPNTILLMVFGP